MDEEVIREVVSKMTGVPLTKINKDETARLLTMEVDLHKAVVQPARGDLRHRQGG